MEYRPAIGQINFNVASVENIQNIDNLNGDLTPFQPQDQGISPLAIAQYMLYDREQEDNTFGMDDAEYLGHKGGFITQGDKLNIKNSSLFIFGKFTVRQKVNLYKNVDISFTSIVNSQRRGSIETPTQRLAFVNEVYRTNVYDYTAMTVGDVREFSYVRGMIMPWVGSFSELFTNLQYWRLCAPPDAGKSINGLVVPNLAGKFIVGGGYTNITDESNNTGTNTYQPTDNAGRPWGNLTTLNIATTGGYHGIRLITPQMPIHNHNVRFSVEGGVTTLNSSAGTFDMYIAGGGVSLGPLRGASDSCAYNIQFQCYESRCNARLTCTWSTYGGGSSIVKITVLDPGTGTIGINDPAVVGGISNSIIYVGNNATHNNIPPYRALGYIMYVGEDRGMAQIPPGTLYPPATRNTTNSFWAGFGASTTTFANQHWVYDVKLTSFYDEVDKKAFIDNSIFNFPAVPLNDATIVNNNIRLTESIQGERGNIFYNKRFLAKDTLNNLIAWQAYFVFSCGGGAGTGDGLSFIISRRDASAPITGTTFGYQGLPESIAIIFDTQTESIAGPYFEPGKIKICRNGSTTPIVPQYQVTPYTISSATQEKRYVWVTYNPSTLLLSVFFNIVNLRPTIPVLTATININDILF